MFKYIYPDRELFLSRLLEVGYTPKTADIYVSAVANQNSTCHSTALRTWVKIMDGIPVPEPVEAVRVGRAKRTEDKPSATYNKPLSENPKLNAIRTIVSLEGISDREKVKMISSLLS